MKASTICMEISVGSSCLISAVLMAHPTDEIESQTGVQPSRVTLQFWAHSTTLVRFSSLVRLCKDVSQKKAVLVCCSENVLLQ